jgi:hypothetical protein
MIIITVTDLRRRDHHHHRHRSPSLSPETASNIITFVF